MASKLAENWIKYSLIVVAIGVGGYVAYKLFKTISGARKLDAAKTVQAPSSDPTAPPVFQLVLPRVTKGENVSTLAQGSVFAKNAAYKYAKVSKTYQDEQGQTVHDFKSPINGYFTDRLLSSGGQLFAEVRPS